MANTGTCLSESHVESRCRVTLPEWKDPPVSSDGTTVWGQGLGIQENRTESVLKGYMIQWNLTYFSEKYLS